MVEPFMRACLSARALLYQRNRMVEPKQQSAHGRGGGGELVGGHGGDAAWGVEMERCVGVGTRPLPHVLSPVSFQMPGQTTEGSTMKHRYRLRLTDAEIPHHDLELHFDWLWNYPIIAAQLWRAWRRAYVQ